MRGLPAKIQTPQDLENIFGLWQDAGWQAQYGKIDTEVLIERLDILCDQQFFHVPVIKVEGKTVTTRFFHEICIGSETNGGLNVTAFEHFTPPEDLPQDKDEASEGETCTKITLSAAFPKGETFIHIKNSCNCLDYNGFDTKRIQIIREALHNSLPKTEVK